MADLVMWTHGLTDGSHPCPPLVPVAVAVAVAAQLDQSRCAIRIIGVHWRTIRPASVIGLPDFSDETELSGRRSGGPSGRSIDPDISEPLLVQLRFNQGRGRRVPIEVELSVTRGSLVFWGAPRRGRCTLRIACSHPFQSVDHASQTDDRSATVESPA
jgi:hypothetical protein